MDKNRMTKTAKKAVFTVYTFCVTLFCVQAAEKVPAWVANFQSVYPEAEWVCVVESAPNRQQALSNATGALARLFKVDVQAMSSSAQSMAQTTANGNSTVTKNSSLSQQVDASSNVSGLMGVINDYYTAKNGTVYVCARMNRRDGAVTYSGTIIENDKTITGLKNDAAKRIGTFEAYACLSLAGDIAVLNDNYLEILSVLNPSARKSIKISYGNAQAIKKLAMENIAAITIVITVTGDENGRVEKAFQQVFTSGGFKTTGSVSQNAYKLSAGLTIENLKSDSADKFARYELNAVLSDPKGSEIIAFSKNGRSGSVSDSEAKQRALRKTESVILDIDDDESFVAEFDAFLSSVLN